jgi:hypothetical protein
MAKAIYSVGQTVYVNTGGDTCTAVITDQNGFCGFFWEDKNFYLCRFDSGAVNYVPAQYISNTKPENFNYYRQQLSDVVIDAGMGEYARFKIFGTNGKATHHIRLSKESAAELIAWLQVNFINLP